MTVNGRKLNIVITLYTYQLHKRIIPHLKQCDIVSLWTWEAADFCGTPGRRKLCQVPDADARQANLAGVIYVGLWREETDAARPDEEAMCVSHVPGSEKAAIKGMILLATNICDLDLETVNWTRSWVAEVGNQPTRGRTVATETERP